MNTKAKTLALIAVTATLGLGGAAIADRGGDTSGMMFGGKHGDSLDGGEGKYGHHKQGYGGKDRGPMHHMDLDDAQRAQLKLVRESFEPQWESLRERMTANREAIRALQDAETLDAGQLGLLADEHGTLVAEMIKMRADMHYQMQALMTDEQRAQMQQRRERHQGRKG